MRRSLAPSQCNKRLSFGSKENDPSSSKINVSSDDLNENDGTTTISRLPLFGFLEIPQSLNKQFKIPCLVSRKGLELRKIKKLGPPKHFHIVRPGDYVNQMVKVSGGASPENGDDDEAEDLPTSVSGLPPFDPLVLWSDSEDPENKVEVIPQLASKLRPHQREGVQFLFECTMGLRGFEGEGCILADDMGLGKTLMSITALWTLMNQGFSKAPGSSAVRKVMVVCPTSLVGNWDNEIRKWVGEGCPTFAVKTEPKKIIKQFLQHRGKGVLIVSYETQRLYSKLFEAAAKTNFPPRKSLEGGPIEGNATGAESAPVSTSLLHKHSNNSICDLLICDEAHKLKNADSGLAKSLNELPARKRILLSGTPMQNELTEFFNMVNFCNPNVLGTNSEFKRRYERPILLAREPDASPAQQDTANKLQKELSTVVNEFILKRGNILNAQHLPPKLVQFVCCRLTPLQEQLYNHLLSSKEMRHIREGKHVDALGAIRTMINICSHPNLLLDTYNTKRASNETISDDLSAMVQIIQNYTATHSSAAVSKPKQLSVEGGVGKSKLSSLLGATRFGQLTADRNSLMPKKGGGGGGGSSDRIFDPELSGKMLVLSRLMQTMRASKQGERIVVVSNYTQTLDLIGQMCTQNNWPVLRLDGTISANKRTKLVDDFNNPHSGAFAFLLSSKAGGCGINLIGGNRLVLFDPDWNPASDKQAAGRIWREGQKRRCFIYRFMSTGTIEEKIIQRQLSKEGLADIVDDREQVNVISTDELKDLFCLRNDTNSDTHDTLRCKRCSYVKIQDYKRSGRNARAAFNCPQAEYCLQFLTDFQQFLCREASAHMSKAAEVMPNDVVLPFLGELDSLRANLRQCISCCTSEAENAEGNSVVPNTGASSPYATLPIFSKAQREVFQTIETMLVQARAWTPAPVDTSAHDGENAEQVEAMRAILRAEEEEEARVSSAYKSLFPASFSIFSEFLNRWMEAVPVLTQLGQKKATSKSVDERVKPRKSISKSSLRGCEEGEGNKEDEEEIAGDGEFVEQEGCPEDTDFNRWSHHCSVNTCDDEVFSNAQGDDSTISFVFGLEVNWSLLEAREAAGREEKELRKEQQRLDLEELNAKRRALKEAQLEKASRKEEVGENEDAGLGDVKSSKKKSKKSTETAVKSTKKAKQAAEKLDDDVHSDSSSDLEGPTVHDIDIFKDGNEEGSPLEEQKVVKLMEKRQPPVEKLKKSAEKNKKGDEKKTPKKPASPPAFMLGPPERVEHKKSFPQDDTFLADWEFLKRQYQKGKLITFAGGERAGSPPSHFNALWKQLKMFNNNWRLIPGATEKEDIFTRTPGLKVENLPKYRAGFDYFSESHFQDFIVSQARHCGDVQLVEEGLFAYYPIIPAAPAVLPPAPSEEPIPTSSGKKRKGVVINNDEEMEDKENIVPLTSNARRSSNQDSLLDLSPTVPIKPSSNSSTVKRNKQNVLNEEDGAEEYFSSSTSSSRSKKKTSTLIISDDDDVIDMCSP